VRSLTQDWWSLLFWLLLTFVAGAVGAIASSDAPEFYLQLQRPDWAPPARLFGPVWSTLYFLMAIAVWLVWRERRLHAGILPYALYVAQLAVNALWSWLFFAWHQGQLAFIEVLVLWALIVATMCSFRTIKPLATWLFVPYLAWVSFAAALTYATWQLNPELL